MATDIIARGMITEYKSGTNISFKENDDGSVTISASGNVSSEDTVARDTIDNHKLDKNNPHNVTAEQVGLGNVNNTADLDKPISTAVQTALDDKANSKHTHNKSDITDFPNSLPANGGNADTVDGFDVAEYVTTLPEGEYYTEVARINTRHKKIESCDTSNLKVGLADYATNADHAMNAGTVNNHTVDSDVPANAVFTDTTNSDMTASGNPVIMDNLQGGVPFSEIVVSGKNLIGSAQAKALTGDNIKGFFVANLSASRSIVQKLQPNTTYHIKKYDSGNRFRIVMFNNEPTNAADTTAIQLIYNDDGSISDYTLTTGEDHLWMALATNYATSGDAIEPIVQLELGDTATPYEPPIMGKELQMNVSGKNLIPYPYSRASGTYNGIELIVHDDGRFDMSGTATASFAILVFAGGSNAIYLSGGQIYTISCNTPYDFSKFNISARIYHTDGSYTSIIKFPTTFVAQEGEYLHCTLWIESDVSVSAKNVELQLELGSTPTAYEPYHGAKHTITPTSNPYVIPNDIRQVDGLNNISVSEGEISVTGVRKNAAVKKIWDEIGMDLLFDGTVTTGTNCITDNVNGYNFLYFYGNLSSVPGESGNVTGSLVIPKTARAISAGQSLVLTTGVIYITVNIINIESGVITFTVTPSDSREIYEFKVFGIK